MLGDNIILFEICGTEQPDLANNKTKLGNFSQKQFKNGLYFVLIIYLHDLRLYKKQEFMPLIMMILVLIYCSSFQCL